MEDPETLRVQGIVLAIAQVNKRCIQNMGIKVVKVGSSTREMGKGEKS